MMTYRKNIISGIKSALILKKNLIANVPKIIFFLKTKIKSCGDEATDFHGKEMAKESSNHTCLAVITIDSALKINENYYPLVFLKQCKYIEKEKSDYTYY